jgi:hypothetical protein
MWAMDSPANADSKFWIVLISGRAILTPFLICLKSGLGPHSFLLLTQPLDEFWASFINQSNE